MSRKRCRRRVYALQNPILLAMQGAAITPEAELDRLRVRELASIDAFARGAATVRDWHDMTAMLNLAEGMAANGIGAEVLPVCAVAQAELIAAAQRFERVGRMGMTGPGLQALRELYQYHDLQRQAVDRSTYERNIERAINRVRSHAPEVVVL